MGGWDEKNCCVIASTDNRCSDPFSDVTFLRPEHRYFAVCVNKSSGEIKIVSTAGQCKSNEALISWNQTGIKAGQAQQDQGLQGLQGTAGVPLGVCSDSATKTYILFPFLTNQAGFDTGVSVANTTSDPFGTTGVAGTCTLNFFGGTTAAPTTPPPPVTTPSIAAGTSM